MSFAFTIENSARTIGRVRNEPIDSSNYNKKAAHERIITELESLFVATSLSSPYTNQLDQLFKEREPYIARRNMILDSFYKSYLPKYKRELRSIDAKLDQIELEIYLLESTNMIKDEEINHLLSKAESNLSIYAKYINQK